MTDNIVQQYAKDKKEFLKEFTKLFLGEKYNERVSNELIKSYIEARLYNYDNEDYTYFYKRIYEYMNNKKVELESKVKDKEALEYNLKMYQFVFYADGVRPIEDIKELASTIYEKRKEEYVLRLQKGLDSKFFKLIKSYTDKKEKFLSSFDTKDFSLYTEKYPNIDNAYMATLNFNFKLPYIYSNKIIEEVYNEGTVNEDKLIIEYMLLSTECIRDVENRKLWEKISCKFCKNLI